MRRATAAQPPWSDLRTEVPEGIPTMISAEERNYVRWLARELWVGRGDVVEIGPWLGGSTWCLATGIAENPERDAAARLHVLDSFRWRDFMSPRAPLGLRSGESFRSHFERNLAPKLDLIEVHEAVLPEDRSDDIQFAEPQRADEEDLPVFSAEGIADEITLLFVDGAKSWRSIVYTLELLGPRLVPGESLLVLQDFQDWASYWIPMATMRLLELRPGALEPLHVLRWNSVAFRVAAPIDRELTGRLERSIDEIDAGRGLALLEEAADLLAGADEPLAAATVRLSGVPFLAAKGDWAAAERRFRRVERGWPWRGGRSSLERTRRWLAERAGRQVPPASRTRAAEALRRAMAALRRLRGRLRRA